MVSNRRQREENRRITPLTKRKRATAARRKKRAAVSASSEGKTEEGRKSGREAGDRIYWLAAAGALLLHFQRHRTKFCPPVSCCWPRVLYLLSLGRLFAPGHFVSLFSTTGNPRQLALSPVPPRFAFLCMFYSVYFFSIPALARSLHVRILLSAEAEDFRARLRRLSSKNCENKRGSGAGQRLSSLSVSCLRDALIFGCSYFRLNRFVVIYYENVRRNLLHVLVRK